MRKALSSFLAPLLAAVALLGAFPASAQTSTTSTLLSAVTATGAGTTTSTERVATACVHVYSASTSVTTNAIQLSVDGTAFYTVATVSNPTSAGELWCGPVAKSIRANVTARSSGTITAKAFFSQVPSTGWRKIDASPVSVSLNGTSTVVLSGSTSLLKFSWTLADLAIAATTGNVAAFSLPPKTVVRNAYIVITTQGTHGSTLTVSLGRTSSAYADLIAASDAKAAASTIYGDASADRGTLLGYDLPSLSASTTVNLQFISGSGNLSTVTASAGDVYLEVCTLP